MQYDAKLVYTTKETKCFHLTSYLYAIFDYKGWCIIYYTAGVWPVQGLYQFYYDMTPYASI